MSVPPEFTREELYEIYSFLTEWSDKSWKRLNPDVYSAILKMREVFNEEKDSTNV